MPSQVTTLGLLANVSICSVPSRFFAGRKKFRCILETGNINSYSLSIHGSLGTAAKMTQVLVDTFRLLQTELFQGLLGVPVFVPNARRSSIFHFESPNVLEIGTGVLESKRESLLDDLVHCMVHMQNYLEGDPDQRANQYHTLGFARKAVEVGLFVACHPTRGWAITFSNPKLASGMQRVRRPEVTRNAHLLQLYQAVPLLQAHLETIRAMVVTKQSERHRRTTTLKYACGCLPPHNSLRSGRRPEGVNPLDVTCNICGKKFGLVPDKANSP